MELKPHYVHNLPHIFYQQSSNFQKAYTNKTNEHIVSPPPLPQLVKAPPRLLSQMWERKQDF